MMFRSSFIALVAPDALQEQLDRIEAKLDALLSRLEPEAAGPEAEAGSDSQAAVPEPEDQPAVAAPERYAPGAIAVVRAAPTEARRFGEVPADSVGGFVYTGGSIVPSDLSDRGVRYTGLAGIKLQGWLRATGPGRTQIAADLQIGFSKGANSALPGLFTAWLEGQSIGNAT